MLRISLQRSVQHDTESGAVHRSSKLINPRSAAAIRNYDRVLPQRVIAKNERGHRFDDRHGSWKNTRIMPSAGGKLSLLIRSGDGFLFERNRCWRLKRNAKVNVFAIANATLHASGVVRGCPNSSSAS